jgi:hypothetical protein
MRAVLATALAVVLVAPMPAQWRTHQALSSSLQTLVTTHRGRAEVTVLATSPGGRAVQALRIGAGADVASRPALLVVANASGSHLVGSEIAVATAERLLAAYGRTRPSRRCSTAPPSGSSPGSIRTPPRRRSPGRSPSGSATVSPTMTTVISASTKTRRTT